MGEGFEKSLRGGSRSFRCVSIESSEYRRDLRRKSTVNGTGFVGMCLGGGWY